MDKTGENYNWSFGYIRSSDGEILEIGSRDGLDCVDDTECPDGGKCKSSTVDDLPALTYPGNIKGVIAGYCVGGPGQGESCKVDNDCAGWGYCYNVLKEFMFFYDQGQCSSSGILCQVDKDCPAISETCNRLKDSIGIRIYQNGEHLSPSAWYEKYLNNPGNYSTEMVDGYKAISSGRTHYINFAVDTNPFGGHSIYTNMFLLSFTDDYQPLTLSIDDQLLANLKFNINSIDDARTCINGTSGGSGAVEA